MFNLELCVILNCSQYFRPLKADPKRLMCLRMVYTNGLKQQKIESWYISGWNYLLLLQTVGKLEREKTKKERTRSLRSFGLLLYYV